MSEPRRGRIRATHLASVMPDPLAEAVFTDTIGIAGDLSDVLEALKGFDAATIKGLNDYSTRFVEGNTPKSGGVKKTETPEERLKRWTGG